MELSLHCNRPPSIPGKNPHVFGGAVQLHHCDELLLARFLASSVFSTVEVTRAVKLSCRCRYEQPILSSIFVASLPLGASGQLDISRSDK